MKAIFSFYSKYFLDSLLLGGKKYIGGFKTPEAFLGSIVLSVCLAQKWFQDVVFITDKFGERLIDPLDLPISKIHSDLDEKITEKEQRFWAIGKIKSHLYQDEPYCHIDYDLYLWKCIPKEMLKADVFCSHREYNYSHYMGDIADYVQNGDHNLLPELNQYLLSYKEIPAFNTGIVGGNNVSFMRQYAQEICDYLNNTDGNFIHKEGCVFLEQYYLGAKAKVENVRILSYNDFFGHRMVRNGGMEHYLGSTKRKDDIQERIFCNVKKFFPDYMGKIERAYKAVK